MTVMPAIFFGLGNPMNALVQNTYGTDNYEATGSALPKQIRNREW
jgi:aromatic ring-opening dioxygenase catalytic subunit (LigB family)